MTLAIGSYMLHSRPVTRTLPAHVQVSAYLEHCSFSAAVSGIAQDNRSVKRQFTVQVLEQGTKVTSTAIRKRVFASEEAHCWSSFGEIPHLHARLGHCPATSRRGGSGFVGVISHIHRLSLGARTPWSFLSVGQKKKMRGPASTDHERGEQSLDGTAACQQVPQSNQNGSPCILPGDLGTVEALAHWLEERMPVGSPGVRLWGQAQGTKRVANLWTELVQGEIVLEDARPPKRTVHVASVRIRNQAGHILLESQQEMGDGSVRSRNRPLSEKMQPHETVAEACLRGIREELGGELGAHERVTLLEGTYARAEEERDSFSYPGLMTRYIVHTMDAFVDRLPEGAFETEENEQHVVGNGASTSGKEELEFRTEGRDVEPGRQREEGLVQGDDSGRTSEQDMQQFLASSKGPVGVKKHFWVWVQEEAYKELVT